MARANANVPFFGNVISKFKLFLGQSNPHDKDLLMNVKSTKERKDGGCPALLVYERVVQAPILEVLVACGYDQLFDGHEECNTRGTRPCVC